MAGFKHESAAGFNRPVASNLEADANFVAAYPDALGWTLVHFAGNGYQKVERDEEGFADPKPGTGRAHIAHLACNDCFTIKEKKRAPPGGGACALPVVFPSSLDRQHSSPRFSRSRDDS